MEHNILAVDDEPGILRLIEKMISEKTPYRITSTNNALELPKLLEDNSYDLILSDLKMPGMSGLDLLRMIKESNRNEKVIILTAFGSVETAVEAISLGVFDYIIKPFKTDQIIDSVEKAILNENNSLDCDRIMQILNTTPYDKAEKAFLEAYIVNLAHKCNNNLMEMARISCLPEELIKIYQ